MITWEYLIIELPRLEAPTTRRTEGGSPAVALLNNEGREGWEAVGLLPVGDGEVAVLLKRPLPD